MVDIGIITQQIKKSVTAITPDCTLLLYGSYARGDYSPNSDIDILVLINKDKITFADRMKITSPVYSIELDTGIIISLFIVSKKTWLLMHKSTPFYENVMKDGILL